jgi:cell division protein FtsB
MKLRYAIPIFIVSIILFSTVFGEKGLYKYGKLQSELEANRAKLERVKEENEVLRREAEILKKKDPHYIEKIAREELRLVRPNEKTYLFSQYSSWPGKRKDK